MRRAHSLINYINNNKRPLKPRANANDETGKLMPTVLMECDAAPESAAAGAAAAAAVTRAQITPQCQRKMFLASTLCMRLCACVCMYT